MRGGDDDCRDYINKDGCNSDDDCLWNESIEFCQDKNPAYNTQ